MASRLAIVAGFTGAIGAGWVASTIAGQSVSVRDLAPEDLYEVPGPQHVDVIRFSAHENESGSLVWDAWEAGGKVPPRDEALSGFQPRTLELSGDIPAPIVAGVANLASQALTSFRGISCDGACPGDEEVTQVAVVRVDDVPHVSAAIRSSEWSQTRSHAYPAPAGVVTAAVTIINDRLMPAWCVRGGLCTRTADP